MRLAVLNVYWVLTYCYFLGYIQLIYKYIQLNLICLRVLTLSSLFLSINVFLLFVLSCYCWDILEDSHLKTAPRIGSRYIEIILAI